MREVYGPFQPPPPRESFWGFSQWRRSNKPSPRRTPRYGRLASQQDVRRPITIKPPARQPAAQDPPARQLAVIQPSQPDAYETRSQTQTRLTDTCSCAWWGGCCGISCPRRLRQQRDLPPFPAASTLTASTAPSPKAPAAPSPKAPAAPSSVVPVTTSLSAPVASLSANPPYGATFTSPVSATRLEQPLINEVKGPPTSTTPSFSAPLTNGYATGSYGVQRANVIQSSLSWW
jgi:hypothetical protein